MFPNLNAEMARYKVSPKDIAETLERTVERTRDKLTGRVSTSTQEAEAIRNKHFPGMSLDYLFETRETFEARKDQGGVII
jgi:hypothetical protein